MTKRSFISGVTSLMTAFLVLMSGCNDTDTPSPVEPSLLEGKIPANQLTLTLNGKEVPTPAKGALTFKNNKELPAADFSYVMDLAVDYIYDLSVPQYILNSDKKRYPVMDITNKNMPVTVSGNEDSMTIEGDFIDKSLRYIVSGKIENPASESDRHVYVNVDTQLPESVRMAGTYEIRFDESSLNSHMDMWDPEMTIDIFGKTLNYEECANEFRKRTSKAFVENSGYEAARITLNPDCTMDVEFKDAKSGEYVKVEGDFTYALQDRLIIFACSDQMAWQIQEWRKLTDNEPYDMFALNSYGYGSGGKFHAIYQLINYKQGEFLYFRHFTDLTFLNMWSALSGHNDFSDMFKLHNFLCGIADAPLSCNHNIIANGILD